MRTSKIIIASLFFFAFTVFAASAEENPKNKKAENTCCTTKDTKSSLSQAEAKFIEEMEEYFTKKYSNPLNVLQNKAGQIVVVRANGNTIQEVNLAKNEQGAFTLPANAEKLMVKGNTAYYIILD
jgi:ABC-type transporter MlaC component